MLEIKFKKNTGKKSTAIIVNGSLAPKSYLIEKHGSFFRNGAVLKDLISHPFIEVGQYFDSIDFDYHMNWWAHEFIVQVYFRASKNPVNMYESKMPSIVIEISIDTDHWSEGYSITKFSNEFKTVVKNSKNSNILLLERHESNDSGYGIIVNTPNTSNTIQTLLDEAMIVAHDLIRQTKDQLKLNADVISIVSIFDFPESIKNPCQQYLMYFVQFLKDLGIEAESEIKQQDSSTIFKIIPHNKEEALDKIREALDAYLSAPGLSDLQYHNKDIASIQFQANVMHLKSQLMFANSSLQMKDATIEALQLSNYQLKNLLISNSEQSNKETDIIPGILSVKKYDGNGYSVNLPEIINRLKRFLK